MAAPPNDLDPASRVEHGWQTIRRARFAALAPHRLATAVLLVFLAIGVRATLFPPSAAAPPAPTVTSADAPSHDFALQFARAYLTYDAADPAARERALAPFVSQGLAAGAGFTPDSGSRKVFWAQVASDQPALAGGRAITVAAEVSDQSAPLYLAVTVRHDPGQPLSLVGYPSLIGAPAIDTAADPPSRTAVTEPAVAQVSERVLRNYLAASAPNLRADLTGSADVTLPTIRLRVEEVTQILWVGGPNSGAVLATLTATDEAANTYTLTYELGIAYRERPYVDFIEVVPTRS
jgi:Conjugative transposon protein TcpC